MKNPYCCYVDCDFDAEFEIWDRSDSHAGVDVAETHACKDHVGDLLTSAVGTVPYGEWLVILIRKVETG